MLNPVLLHKTDGGQDQIAENAKSVHRRAYHLGADPIFLGTDLETVSRTRTKFGNNSSYLAIAFGGERGTEN